MVTKTFNKFYCQCTVIIQQYCTADSQLWATFLIGPQFIFTIQMEFLSCLEHFKGKPRYWKKKRRPRGRPYSRLWNVFILRTEHNCSFPSGCKHKHINHTREELQWEVVWMWIKVFVIYNSSLCLAGLLLINCYMNLKKIARTMSCRTSIVNTAFFVGLVLERSDRIQWKVMVIGPLCDREFLVWSRMTRMILESWRGYDSLVPPVFSWT